LDENKVTVYSIGKNVAYDFIEMSEKEKKKIISNSKMIYFGTLGQRNIVSKNTIQSLLTDKTINFCDLNLRQEFYNKEIIESSLKKCDILKLNKDELKLVSQLFFGRTSILKIDVIKLIKLFNIYLVAVTRGERGARIFTKFDSVTHRPPKISIVDTVGAGDAYSSILA
jgi:fructokinase